MLGILVGFGAVILAYILMRTQGGHGTTISIKMPPAGTPEARRTRIVIICAMLLAAGGVIFASFGSGLPIQQQILAILTFLALSLGGFLAVIGRNRSK